jgi:hypothetical protein
MRANTSDIAQATGQSEDTIIKNMREIWEKRFGQTFTDDQIRKAMEDGGEDEFVSEQMNGTHQHEQPRVPEVQSSATLESRVGALEHRLKETEEQVFRNNVRCMSMKTMPLKELHAMFSEDIKRILTFHNLAHVKTGRNFMDLGLKNMSEPKKALEELKTFFGTIGVVDKYRLLPPVTPEQNLVRLGTTICFRGVIEMLEYATDSAAGYLPRELRPTTTWPIRTTDKLDTEESSI